MSEIKMARNSCDVWPPDEPVGSFDIERGAPIGYEATAHILFVCPNGRRCGVLLGPKPVNRTSADRLCVWRWDGNMDEPTIEPSINCISESDGKPTGGCGWHGFITKGIMR